MLVASVQNPTSETIRPLPARVPSRRPSILLYYVVEGLSSHGVAMMLSSIYFYTQYRFGWGSAQNYLLAAVLGVVYVVAALLAHAVTARLGRRRTLIVSYVCMAGLAGAALVARSPLALCAALFFYSGVSAITWPALESLVATGARAGEMSKRLGIYNCVWAGAGAATLAISGTIIANWPKGIFILPAATHTLVAFLLLIAGRTATAGGESASADKDVTDPTREHGPPQSPEPELLRVRTRALWMSRLALPATFVVISSLLATMPTLPLITRLEPAERTIVGSVWMAFRWLAFLVLGMTTWWHTRPRVLLVAAVVILIGFVAVTFQSEWLPGAPHVGTKPWLLWLVLWQAALGAALGMIYSTSLYFGMVLSDGSTEHGGYHEALIGLGTVLGPGAGALAEWAGNGDPRWGVTAVAGVLGVSVLACAVVGLRRDRRPLAEPAAPLTR